MGITKTYIEIDHGRRRGGGGGKRAILKEDKSGVASGNQIYRRMSERISGKLAEIFLQEKTGSKKTGGGRKKVSRG